MSFLSSGLQAPMRVKDGDGCARYFMSKFNPRDPITETENGFMEPKYYAFRFGDWTPQSSSDVR